MCSRIIEEILRDNSIGDHDKFKHPKWCEEQRKTDEFVLFALPSDKPNVNRLGKEREEIPQEEIQALSLVSNEATNKQTNKILS